MLLTSGVSLFVVLQTNSAILSGVNTATFTRDRGRRGPEMASLGGPACASQCLKSLLAPFRPRRLRLTLGSANVFVSFFAPCHT